MAEICKTFEREQEQVLKKKAKIFRPVVLHDLAHWEAMKDAYISGRESMRQEAMKAADDQWVKDPRVSASDAIKAIV